MPVSAQLCAAVLAAALSPGQPPPTPRTVEVGRAALDEFALRAGGLVFNNFRLAEQPPQVSPEYLPDAPAELALRGTFRNGADAGVAFTLVVVGVDADGELLWACHVPGHAPGNDVGLLQGVASVPPGTLRQTATVRLRARLTPPAPPAPAVTPPPAALP